MLNIEYYFHFVEHIKTIDKVAIFNLKENTIPVTKYYGIHLIASGIDAQGGYKWCGLSTPLEDTLFVDSALEEVF